MPSIHSTQCLLVCCERQLELCACQLPARSDRDCWAHGKLLVLRLHTEVASAWAAKRWSVSGVSGRCFHVSTWRVGGLPMASAVGPDDVAKARAVLTLGRTIRHCDRHHLRPHQIL